MRTEIDPPAISLQHDALAQLYRSRGIDVFYVEPPVTPPPNQLFAADTFVMTPGGAIVARPASAVRAGEERWVARALAKLGIPIVRSVGGGGTFEGADLMWLAPDAALVAEGLRTNAEGANQVAGALGDLGVKTFRTHLPPGTMHLMGQLRILDRELALGWPGRLPEDAVQALEASEFEVVFLPDDTEAQHSFAFNFVVLGPREIVMPSGNPQTQGFYEDLGISCHTVDVEEIGKAAGSIGCLTGILEREQSLHG
jgi:N-dimethylarginine dimethylaminohydrolase